MQQTQPLRKDQGPHIDKIYLYIKNPFESKYQLLTNGREKVRITKLKAPLRRIWCLYLLFTIYVYENLEDYNPTKKKKVLIVLDGMIADTEANEKLSSVVTEFFLRGGKLNISFVFILQSFFQSTSNYKTKHNIFYYENT